MQSKRVLPIWASSFQPRQLRQRTMYPISSQAVSYLFRASFRGQADGGIKGTLGAGLSLEDGQKAAQLACLNLLAQVKAALGSFDRVGQTLRLTGFVNATADFRDHPVVINGASDLLVAVLGDKGRHTRAAIGASSLPSGFAVEIDAIFAAA